MVGEQVNCKLCNKPIDTDNCSVLTLLTRTHDFCGDCAAREKEFHHLLDAYDRLKYGMDYDEYKRIEQEMNRWE